MYKDFHMILACGHNGEIGGNQDLLWHLPKDMARFVQHTKGCNVVMGRNTYMSLPSLPGLPGRTNIVVTSRPDEVLKEYEKRLVGWTKTPPRLMCAETLDEAATLCNDPIANQEKAHMENFIIGGAALYNYAIEQDVVEKIYRTIVHGVFPEADTVVRYLDYNAITFQPKHVLHIPADEENQYAMTFETWERY